MRRRCWFLGKAQSRASSRSISSSSRASAFGLARLRQWRWLAIAAAVGAIAWGLIMVAAGSDALTDAAYALALLLLALVFLVVDVHQGDDRAERPDLLASLVAAGFAALLVIQASALALRPPASPAALIGGALLLAAAWRYRCRCSLAPALRPR